MFLQTLIALICSDVWCLDCLNVVKLLVVDIKNLLNGNTVGFFFGIMNFFCCCRKILAESVLVNATFQIELLLYKNANLTTALLPNDEVLSSSFIYVEVKLMDIDDSNSRLYVEVHITKFFIIDFSSILD